MTTVRLYQNGSAYPIVFEGCEIIYCARDTSMIEFKYSGQNGKTFRVVSTLRFMFSEEMNAKT
jgi:hypothetical protein